MGASERYAEWLPRDAAETRRLNLQHELLKEAFGGLLHPIIQESIRPGTHIAEIATGTGIVLTELSSQLPKSCVFDGFDISDAQFPPESQRPLNVKYHLLDATMPGSVPNEFHGKYDVVLIRFLVLALQPWDWQVVAENARDLLKPGGYIQWIEIDPLTAARLTQARPDVYVPGTGTAVSELADLFFPDQAAREALGFPGMGMKRVIREVFRELIVHGIVSGDRDPAARRAWTDMFLALWEDMLLRTEKAKGSNGSQAEVEKLMQNVRRADVYARVDLHRYVARK